MDFCGVSISIFAALYSFRKGEGADLDFEDLLRTWSRGLATIRFGEGVIRSSDTSALCLQDWAFPETMDLEVRFGEWNVGVTTLILLNRLEGGFNRFLASLSYTISHPGGQR